MEWVSDGVSTGNGSGVVQGTYSGEGACDLDELAIFGSSGEAADEETFVNAFADAFEIERSACSLDSRLVEDLGFDSLAFAEVVSFLDVATASVVSMEVLATIQCVGDVYFVYAQDGERGLGVGA